MRTTGLVVNPIAGMGGRVGLKGTDGNVERARELGAAPRARERAREALEALAGTGADVDLLAAGGVMGERVSRDGGFEPTVVSDPPDETTAADTRSAVAAFLDRGADLILFVGGDGTAVDVAETIEDRDADVPMLGVPAGVKIFSAVFGVTPAAAGRIAATYERTERAEVNDVDEERYREGEVRPELRAVVSVPATPDRQGGKERVGGNVEPPAQAVAEVVVYCVRFVFCHW
jgi:NAD+ kinase